MTPKQLADFDAACRESGEAGDQWLDRLLLDEMRRYQSPDLGVPTRTKDGRPGRPCYMVSRGIAAFEPDVSEPRKKLEPSPSFMRMIEAANLPPTLRKLHAGGGIGIGSELPDQVRQAFLGEGLLPSTDYEVLDPDEQALACLRLLQVYRETGRQSWLFTAAAMRLKELLVAHPVLMHPRLLWDVSNREKTLKPQLISEERNPAPMAHILVQTVNADLPLPSGMTQGAFKAFATHPAVGAGLTAVAPQIAAATTAYGTVNQSVGEVMYGSRQPAFLCNFLTAAMAIHRVRVASGLSGVIPGGRGHGGTSLSGFVDVAADSFRVAWSRSDMRSCDAALLQEFNASKANLPRRMSVNLHNQVSEIFVEDPLDAPDVPSEDPWGRFERFKANLVQVGAYSDQGQASDAVFDYLMPAAGSVPIKSSRFRHIAVAETETTGRFIDHWIEEGRNLDAMHAGIHQFMPKSAWRTMIDVKKAEADMNRVIETQLAGTASSGSTTPKRRDNRII